MKRVLVSGAGIAGMATAYWLHRYGFEVTVVERTPEIRRGGYAVDIRGAALDVLERMGLTARARREGTDTLATSFVDVRGRRVATMERGFGVIDASDIEIMRGDLVRLLYEPTSRDGEFIFSDSIAALEESGQGLLVRFEHASPRKFDLVIGADGVHSAVRELVFGEESQFVRHLGSYMAVFSAPNFLELDRWQTLFQDAGRAVSVKSSRGNTDVKVTAFFASDPLRYDRKDVMAQKAIVTAAFSHVGWELPRLLAAMAESPDFYFDATCLIRMPAWSRGCVTLVGDACVCASPFSGQGTGLALVGAYVLAGELAAAAGDHEAALVRYEQVMRPYAERNQRGAEALAKHFAPRTLREAQMRNFALKLLRYVPLTSLMFKMAARATAKSSRAITLNEYGLSLPQTSLS
jgi:2-polyprenyl-6-methoxyphenol hydroxylase-like FAD-dependent oxidoreductase